MAADQPSGRTQDPAAVLERWEGAGGTWRVIGRRGDEVTISLLQCDGGTEAERLASADPGLARYIAGRSSSEETR